MRVLCWVGSNDDTLGMDEMVYAYLFIYLFIYFIREKSIPVQSKRVDALIAKLGHKSVSIRLHNLLR